MTKAELEKHNKTIEEIENLERHIKRLKETFFCGGIEKDPISISLISLTFRTDLKASLLPINPYDFVNLYVLKAERELEKLKEEFSQI